ncbi:MAG: hypothetical protein GXP32_07525 [Kiritimatiellaeota bacterium]|nr:hypothetical protein [Kiritimatiellota bacterium]
MRTLSCAKCGAEINPSVLREDSPYKCPVCRNLQHTEVFPAFFDQVAKGEAPEKALLDEDARCFNHPDKIAAVPCAECGIFLCGLCDINADGVHLCSKCFKNKKNELENFAGSTTVYDDFFILLAILPMIILPFVFLTIITAPTLLVCAFLFRKKIDNQPYAMIHWKYYTAIVIAALQLLLWLSLPIIAVTEKG